MRKTLLLIAAAVLSVTNVIADNVWWGYASEDGNRNALGTNATGVMDQAIFISGNNPATVGNAIKAVRFYLRSTKNITDVKLWLSTSLPNTADEADVLVKNLNIEELNGGDEGANLSGTLNEVELDEPYTITTKGVYVGYSYNVTSIVENSGQYPIVIGTEAGTEESLYLHTSNMNWDSYGESYGPLMLSVQLEGNFLKNAVSPAFGGEVVTVLGNSAKAAITLTNGGTTGISSIDYTITTDGVTGSEEHLELATPFTVFGGKTKVQIPFAADGEVGIKEKVLTITKVNGVVNETELNTVTIPLTTLMKNVNRGIAVEEFTGTTCGWCPRGLIGMEKLRKTFGDAFIGIGIHTYTRNLSQDAMYISTYDHVTFSGAPSARINRGDEIDPYYGSGISSLDDFRAAQDIPAKAGLTVEGQWNADSTNVTAIATIEPLIDGNYTIEYVLIADSLTGSTLPWRQYNYFNKAYNIYTSPSQLPEDLSFLFDEGQIFNNQYVAYYPIFNDVAIANAKSTETTALGQLTVGEEQTNSYTLSMPTGTQKANLIKAIDKNKVYVIALLIDEYGKIANAAKSVITGGDITQGIAQPKSAAANAAAQRYALDGRQLNGAQRGLNIIRMADGSVKKVIIK